MTCRSHGLKLKTNDYISMLGLDDSLKFLKPRSSLEILKLHTNSVEFVLRITKAKVTQGMSS